MPAEFSIYPLGETHHLSKDVARIVGILNEAGLPFEVGSLSTAIEDDWERVLGAIHKCHATMVVAHERVTTRITIDKCRSGQHHLAEMVKSVKKELASHNHDADIEC